MKIRFPLWKTSLLIALTLTTCWIQAQIKVSRIEKPDQLAGRNGIIYNLPRTVLNVDLCVSKSQQFAGPLAQYASEFLGIDDAITKESTSYNLEKAMLRSENEPDPGQMYLIEKEDKSQQEVWVSFGKEPRVLTLESYEKTSSPDGFTTWNKDLYTTGDAGQLFRKYTDSPTREVTDTIIRKVSLDTLVYEEQIFRHSREEYSDREKAQDAADKIRQIDHDIYNLMIGYPETAYSKESLEYMIGRLEAQKAEYLKLFTGVTIKETMRFSFSVIPDPEKEVQVYKVASFTKTAGIAGPEGQNEIVLTLAAEGSNNTGSTVGGLVYQIPAKARAVLTYQGRELASAGMGVMQLGTKMSLPATFKKIELDLETGSLRNVVME